MGEAMLVANLRNSHDLQSNLAAMIGSTSPLRRPFFLYKLSVRAAEGSRWPALQRLHGRTSSLYRLAGPFDETDNTAYTEIGIEPNQ
jgi:hypothetical protein